MRYSYLNLEFCEERENICTSGDIINIFTGKYYLLASLSYRFETSDSVVRSEKGILISRNGDTVLNVDGQFSFRFPDGTSMTVTFVATEEGYQPSVSIGEGNQVAPSVPSILPPPASPIPSAALASLAGGGIG